MLDTFNPQVNSLYSQNEDNKIKPKAKRRIFFPKNKRTYTLVYSTRTNQEGQKS